MRCSIRKCKSISVKGGSISFFTFPKEESVANEWLRHCGPKTNSKNGRVCSIHFLPSDYLRSLRNILLNIAPKHGKQLKPDAIPTLQLESIDEQNPPKVMINVKNEIINTVENVNFLPQCNALHANEVAGSSEVIENRPIEDNQNTPKVKIEIVLTKENMNCLPQFNTMPANEVSGLSEVIENRPIKHNENTPKVKIEIEDTTENINCLPQYTAIPTNGVVGLYKALEKRPINNKQNTPIVKVERENGIILTAENMNRLPQFITIPPNEAVESSKVNNKSDETITISLAEHKAFMRNTNELKNLKHNLSKIFTSGQIRCLTNPTRRRVRWKAEDIAAAISLRRKSPQGYRFMRVTVGIPFPGCSTLRKWEAKNKHRVKLLENVVKVDHTYAE